MVARPPVRLTSAPMQVDHLPEVQAIEKASFTSPWPPHAYRSELESNRLAHYVVVQVAGRVIAYGGIWLMVDEAHVTTFAVHPLWRRRHIGDQLRGPELPGREIHRDAEVIAGDTPGPRSETVTTSFLPTLAHASSTATERAV